MLILYDHEGNVHSGQAGSGLPSSGWRRSLPVASLVSVVITWSGNLVTNELPSWKQRSRSKVISHWPPGREVALLLVTPPNAKEEAAAAASVSPGDPYQPVIV